MNEAKYLPCFNTEYISHWNGPMRFHVPVCIEEVSFEEKTGVPVGK